MYRTGAPGGTLSSFSTLHSARKIQFSGSFQIGWTWYKLPSQTMAGQEIVADSLVGFIKIVSELRDNWQKEDEKAQKRSGEDYEPGQCWFRGQASSSWDLKPRLYRLQNANENEIRSEFKRRALQLMSEPHFLASDREWYFLMQHFKVPTRLLDWSDGALIALYFAVSSQRRRRDAAVWVLDPVWLNRETLKDSYVSGVMLWDWKEAAPWFPTPFEENLHVELPVAIDPPHVARRVAVQRSRFTIHGTNPNGVQVVAREAKKSRLVKIVVRKAAIDSVIRDLTTGGIVETTVYPDLEGLARELELEWAKK